MKERTVEGFGARLTEIRKSRGLTQAELGARVGASNRVIAYYESDEAQPPGAMLADLATALDVTADTLLGLEPARPKASPRTARLMKRLARVEKLPPADQRAVLQHIDALLATRGVAADSNGHEKAPAQRQGKAKAKRSTRAAARASSRTTSR